MEPIHVEPEVISEKLCMADKGTLPIKYSLALVQTTSGELFLYGQVKQQMTMAEGWLLADVLKQWVNKQREL